MKKFCVIGNPIDHSLSPKLHNFWFKKNKIDAIYEKKLLTEKEIPKLIESLRKTEINIKDGVKDGYKCIFKRQLKGKDVTVMQPSPQCQTSFKCKREDQN